MQEVDVILNIHYFHTWEQNNDSEKYGGKEHLWSILALREGENIQTLTKQTILILLIFWQMDLNKVYSIWMNNTSQQLCSWAFWETLGKTNVLVIYQECYCLTIKALDLKLIDSNLGHVCFPEVTPYFVQIWRTSLRFVISAVQWNCEYPSIQASKKETEVGLFDSSSVQGCLFHYQNLLNQQKWYWHLHINLLSIN